MEADEGVGGLCELCLTAARIGAKIDELSYW